MEKTKSRKKTMNKKECKEKKVMVVKPNELQFNQRTGSREKNLLTVQKGKKRKKKNNSNNNNRK